MWCEHYADRLTAWSLLRHQCAAAPVDQALLAINHWWFAAPMISRGLIWEQHEHWPDPWQLLAQDGLCDLARGLGMLYTVNMIAHADITDCSIAQTDHDNLVLVDQGKYILNWAPGPLLNILSRPVTVRRHLDGAAFNHLAR